MRQVEFTPSSYAEIKSLSKGIQDITLRLSFSNIPDNFHIADASSAASTICAAPKANLSDLSVILTATREKSRSFVIGDVKAEVKWDDVPVVTLGWVKSNEPLYSDLRFRSYVVDGPGIAHYSGHDRQALHVGLGEPRAPMDLTGRYFNISATDCFGYEVYHTDPMYKHMPYLVKATPEGCVAIFSTTHSRASWSVGSEIDGLWGHFKVYRQDYGGLEQYIILGRTLQDITTSYAEIVGFPIMAPRWAYGYLSGGYKYTMGDDPPAHQQITNFIEQLKAHEIPCSAHQMSSGYSISPVEPKVRNVFTWNSHRFPDPVSWSKHCHAQGIRLLTNIKPFLLATHPSYGYLSRNGGLFIDNHTGKTATMRLWSAGGGDSGAGSHIDFTNAAAYAWWRNEVQMLRKQGIHAMWNDNNEYTLPSDEWRMSLQNVTSRDEQPLQNHVGLWGRSLQTNLMAKASYEGLLSAEPNVRPFVLTRSASIGTLRYAAGSWSGDNITSWEGMRGANSLSLNAGISLMHCYGHDIGGFEGPQPSPELLLRWVQLGTYSPRFAINCFKTSSKDNAIGEVIEPWMYPEITPLIRAAIKRRYEIMPYIYSLALEGSLTATPPQRWIGWGYETDPEVWSKRLKAGEEQYWFGNALLIGGVYEPGIETVQVYLPRKTKSDFDYGYMNVNAPFEYFAAGQWTTISSPWRTSIPVLARVGSAIPIGKSVQTRMPGEEHPVCSTLENDDYRGLEIFPPKGSSHGTIFSSTFYDDDGLSLHPIISSWTVSYSSTDEKVTVGVTHHERNVFQPPWRERVTFILPYNDKRHIVANDGRPVEKVPCSLDDRVRYVYKL